MIAYISLLTFTSSRLDMYLEINKLFTFLDHLRIYLFDHQIQPKFSYAPLLQILTIMCQDYYHNLGIPI